MDKMVGRREQTALGQRYHGAFLLCVLSTCNCDLTSVRSSLALFSVALLYAKANSVTLKFADEQITSQHILDEITGYIRTSDFSLFDITDWNPNVALELGIAVGLVKKYFILFNPKPGQNQDAPSDIRGIDRIQYASNVELEAKLNLLIKQESPRSRTKSDNAFDSVKSRIIDALKNEQGQSVRVARHPRRSLECASDAGAEIAKRHQPPTSGAQVSDCGQKPQDEVDF